MFTFMWHGTEDWSPARMADSLARAKAHVLEASKAG
jgi:hypothetical protein